MVVKKADEKFFKHKTAYNGSWKGMDWKYHVNNLNAEIQLGYELYEPHEFLWPKLAYNGTKQQNTKTNFRGLFPELLPISSKKYLRGFVDKTQEISMQTYLIQNVKLKPTQKKPQLKCKRTSKPKKVHKPKNSTKNSK
ncbi:hypothetical protein FQA39_LY00401 [Lamprigera yunnana]|nr:hypothetical protein FQA39_LY00401 [Lamprigera yunnana]